LFAVLGLTAVVLTTRILGFSDLVINRGLGAGAVGRMILFEAVPVLARIFPFGVLLGCLVALGRLGADREILALESSGVAVGRLVWPIVAFAGAMTLVAFYVSLDLAPGSLINERELMERLELGRTPVREALRVLARECLVEVYPRRGMFVSTIDVGDLAGLSEVRAALESHAARLAAERATGDDLAETEALLAELEHAGGDGERALIDLDQRVHRHVYRCAHNPFLEATLNEYYVLILRIWFLALERVTRLEDAILEHRGILEAIRDGDPDRAEAAMRRHVTSFERAIRRVL
jgi:DNA-binding GntR family transcriptional regulator